MAFDYKKKYKELYLPKEKPELIDVPPITYLAVKGAGDPNEDDGTYKHSIQKLYAVSYTIKMSKMGDRHIDGYFDYVVPPLEGFWWTKDFAAPDFKNKAAFNWISCIRLSEFVTKEVFAWAIEEAEAEKKVDLSDVEMLAVDEGKCAQVLHAGPYDDEPKTIAALNAFIVEEGLETDFTQARLHHEIYLSDPRRTKPENCKTVIRVPVK